ncbi:hypothetical protein [Neorhizobium galegae]|uniref:phage adaptor protein n=1 Tax=Neorhizobium galegae TaxID=399 RepID=UPI0006221ED9|nr:hypothetical protein [Neorhizobium galegae]CDZ50416.1 Hypothetical protein NGAL_HAMBI2427_36340 [Neorhizobium galegae bv. orientalis]
MTILSACQSAAIRLVGRKPTTIFSSQKAFELELSDLVQEAAVDIAKAFEWQALMVLAEHQGDGTTTAFDFPAAYDRMPVKGNIHSATWQQSGYRPARDRDHWINLQTYLSAGTPGFWIVLDNKMQIFPPMGPSEKAQYYFITSEIAKSASGNSKTVISADDDVFKLDERLLTLALIWRWKEMKGLEYSESMANYERALAQIGGADKGRRILSVGTRRTSIDADLAFPGTIIP